MNRPICVLVIIYIIVILMLHLNSVAFLDFKRIYEKDGRELQCEAVILDKEEKEYKYVYIIKIESKNKLFAGKKFLLNLKKGANKSVINGNSNIKNDLSYGDKIQFKGKYKKPSEKRNYGGYDYSLYLKTKKIYGTFETNGVKVTSKNNVSVVDRCINNCRKYIKHTLKENLKEKQANLCIGFILGDKKELSEEIKEDFKTASLTHMLAISGAHFSYVILAITYFNKIIKRKRLGQILMIIFIIIFMKLTGNTPSVLRAGIMSIITILASIFHRKSDTWNNLAISILVQLINNPYVIFDIGFELSCGGVVGILIFAKPINNVIESIKNKILKERTSNIIQYILQTINISISANIVIIPIMLLNFNTLSFSFLISNLLAGSLLGIVIILAFILIFFSIFLKTLLVPFFFILNFLLSILISISKVCSTLPLSKIYIVTPNIFLIILFYIFIVSSVKLNNKKKILISLIVVILLNFTIPIIVSNRNNLEINFIDVGQGDSTLIRASNKKILIDGGGSSKSEDFDVGEKVLFPYLLDRGICILDYILVSHFDADHYQGLEYVIKNVKVKNIIVSKLGQESREYTSFIDLAKKKRINIIYVRKRGYNKYWKFKTRNIVPR